MAKMHWQAAPDWVKEVFGEILDSLPGDIEPRQMFGYPCAFLNRNLFIGVHANNLILRLPEAQRKALIEKHEAEQFEPMPGRPMKEYIIPPADWFEGDLTKIKSWAKKSYDYAQTLPPKKPK